MSILSKLFKNTVISKHRRQYTKTVKEVSEVSKISEISEMSETMKREEFLLYRMMRLLIDSKIRIMSKETSIYSVLNCFRLSDSDLYIQVNRVCIWSLNSSCIWSLNSLCIWPPNSLCILSSNLHVFAFKSSCTWPLKLCVFSLWTFINLTDWDRVLMYQRRVLMYHFKVSV